MIVLPQWARKPDHKKTVIATNKGWVVKETGEVLKLVRDLDVKLKALESDSRGISKDIGEVDEKPTVQQYVPEDVEKPVEDDKSEDMVTNTEAAEEVSDETTEDEKEDTSETKEQQKKKPGRKPGPKPKKAE